MAALQPTGLADLVAGTLRDLGKLRFQDIAQKLQRYEVMGSWFKKDKVTFDGAIGIQRNLMARTTGNARHTGITATDTVELQDVLAQLKVDWVHAETYWPFIYQEQLYQKAPHEIVNTIEMRRHAAMLDLADELEDKAWSSPASDNNTDPLGIPYWVVKNSTTGFNGGLPSGHTTVANVNLTSVPTFKNYTHQYTTVSKQSLIKPMRTGFRKINFQAPMDVRDYTKESGRQYRNYVNEATMADIEDIGESQNENLGRDIASMDGGDMLFRKNLIKWIPKLDEDTSNPVYMINHGVWCPVCLKGDYLRETPAIRAAMQHNVFYTTIDLSYNYVCVDRRANAVFYV